MHRLIAALMAVALVASSAQSQTLQFQSIGTLNLSPAAGYGDNVSAIAFLNNTLYVGGYSSVAGGSNTGIVAYSGVIDTSVPGAPTLGAPTVSAAFGVLPTNNAQGITSLAVQGTNLAASYDNGGNTGSNSVRLFNVATPAAATQTWALSAGSGGTAATVNGLRGDGVAFDPGVGGAGAGVGFLSIGGGRRLLADATTGQLLNGPTGSTTPGLIARGAGGNPRDIAFDAAGNVYTRFNNQVTKAVRTGPNGSNTSTDIVVQTAGVNINLQTIAITPLGASGTLFFNDRSTAGSGQAFSSVVKASDLDGNAITLDFGTFAPASGSGAYDFAYDSATATFAISDFTNNTVYFFTPVPEPASCFAAGVAGLAALGAVRRRLKA